MYAIRPSSEKAVLHRITKPIGKKDWPPKRTIKNEQFPFLSLAVCQSFYLDIADTSHYDYRRLLNAILRYNNNYKVKFWKVWHENKTILEIARIS
jgi:hypothetical protein